MAVVLSGLFPTRALLGAFLARLGRQWLSFFLLFVVLAAAMAVCVVLLGAVRYYFAPGRLVDADLWRIDTVWTSGHTSESGHWATSPDPLARLIRQDHGALAVAGRFTPVRSQVVIDELSLPGGAVFRSDQPSLAVFDWKIQKGAFATGQPGPGDALISATEARRLFGKRDPIGLRISLSRVDRHGQASTHTVAAVFTPFAENAVFRPDVVLVDPVPGAIDRDLLPSSLRQLPMEWLRPNAYTFVRIPGQGAHERAEAIAADLTARAPYLGGWVPDFRARAAADIWLSNGAYEELVAAISPALARLLWLGAAVLACVALAAFGYGVALARLQTAALFETLGSLAVPPAAGRMALAGMTAVAAVGFCTLGVAGGIWLSRLVANLLRMDPSAFAITPREGIAVLAACVFVFVAVGLLSLTRRPTASVRARHRPLPLWATFVVGSTAAGLSLVLLLQQLYLARQDTGMSLEGTLALRVDQDGVLGIRHDAFRQELLSLPGVREVGFAKTLPGTLQDYSYMELRAATDRRKTEKRYQALSADAGFLRSIGVELIAGELPENWRERTDQAVLNRSAAEQLGFSVPEEAVGQTLLSFDGGPRVRLHVAAVVEDFRLNGRHVPNSPLVVYHDANLFRAVTIRFDTVEGPSRLGEVVPVWWRLWPHVTPSRIELSAFYGAANRPAEGVALLILGTWITALFVVGGALFAVIRFQSVTCRRELGLRQLLGARPVQLAPVLASRLVMPLLCAIPFAGAATIMLGQAWLSGQAERISAVSLAVLAIVFLGLVLSSVLALASCIAVELFLISRRDQFSSIANGGA
ncbi:ABC transporter permease [Stappia sp. ICDLI1TA098]